MTANKLPPLPEPRLRPYKHLDTVYYNAGQMKEYAREALRQSQSLPAGAVAGLVGKWRDSSAFETDGYSILHRCATELEQALQADAREKGEAEIEPGWKLVSVNGKAFDDLVYWLNELDLPNVLDKAWAAFDYRLATQPAQASEKESHRYTEDDGCPTELAVLQRFWRANQQATSSQETASE